MAGYKGLSIRADAFHDVVPNGTWVRQLEGITVRGVVLPVEGILLRERVDDPKESRLEMDTRLLVTPLGAVDTVRLLAGEVEYKIDDDWISFRELCLRAIEARLKQALRLDPMQIGTHLYALATWLESQGNRGHSDEEIMIGLPTFPIRLLNPEHRPFWESIVFFGESEEKGAYSGWGVHKRKPAHWWMTWVERFGMDHPQADILLEAAWDEALAYQIAHAVKRPSETYVGMEFEKESTQEIAHRAAALWLLAQWAQQRRWQHWEAREIWGLQAYLYNEGSKVFQNELKYRMDQQPKPRRGKKKTQAVRDDWALAHGYFNGWHFNAERFYTLAYLKTCCESDAVPDTGVDFEALPRDIPTVTTDTQPQEAHS